MDRRMRVKRKSACDSPLRPEDSEELITLRFHILLNLSIVLERGDELFQFVDGVLLIREFPPAETHDELHEVAVAEKLFRTIDEAIEIVLFRAVAEAQHLDFRLLAVRFLFLLFLLHLVQKMADIADLHHRRLGLRRNLDEIQFQRFGAGDRIGNGEGLRGSVVVDEENRRADDLFIGTRPLFMDDRSRVRGALTQRER